MYEHLGVRIVGSLIMISGIGLFSWSLRTLGRSLTPSPVLCTRNRLVMSGPYRIMRHPMYSAVLATLLGGMLAFGSMTAILSWGLLALFLDHKSAYEERLLEKRYPEYASYRARRPLSATIENKKKSGLSELRKRPRLKVFRSSPRSRLRKSSFARRP